MKSEFENNDQNTTDFHLSFILSVSYLSPREIGVTVTIHVNVIVITGIGTRRGDLHGWASKGNMYYQIYIVSDVLLSMLVELPEVMIDVMVVEIGGLGIILHRVVDEEDY
jgi:hypothetical protein